MSKPNNWSRSVSRAARSIDDSELSEMRVMQRAYWEVLNSELEQADGPVSGNRKPRPASWMGFPIGRTGFNLSVSMAVSKRQIRPYLYISGTTAKANFHLLHEQAPEIEEELGYPPRMGRSCRREPTAEFACSSTTSISGTRKIGPRQHKWLVTKLNEMHRVFAHRVRALDPDEWTPESAARQESATTRGSKLIWSITGSPTAVEPPRGVGRAGHRHVRSGACETKCKLGRLHVGFPELRPSSRRFARTLLLGQWQIASSCSKSGRMTKHGSDSTRGDLAQPVRIIMAPRILNALPTVTTDSAHPTFWMSS